MTDRREIRALDIVVLVLAVAGLAVSAYLTYEHYTASATLACPETTTLNCAKVTTSGYSTLVGFPVAALGLGFYVVMVALTVPRPWPAYVLRTRLALSVVGVCFVLYLVWAELFRIDAICLWCTGVHVLTLALFATLSFQEAARVPGVLEDRG